MTFGIDEKNRPFYRVEQNQKPRTRKIEFEDGSFTYETITPKPKTHDEYDLEKLGWQKIVRFETIELLMQANPKRHYRLEPALWHRIYEIDVKRYYKYNPCPLCTKNGIGSKLHYLRCMNQGIFHICWLKAAKFGVSSSGPIRTMENAVEGTLCKWVKLISEKRVSKSKAKQILNRLQQKPNFKVSMFLQGLDVIG